MKALCDARVCVFVMHTDVCVDFLLRRRFALWMFRRSSRRRCSTVRALPLLCRGRRAVRMCVLVLAASAAAVRRLRRRRGGAVCGALAVVAAVVRRGSSRVCDHAAGMMTRLKLALYRPVSSSRSERERSRGMSSGRSTAS